MFKHVIILVDATDAGNVGGKTFLLYIILGLLLTINYVNLTGDSDYAFLEHAAQK